MSHSIKRISVLISLLILVSGIIFVINQTNQVIQLATGVDERLGQAVSWGLIAIYAVLILIPIILFFRLPKALVPPNDEASPEFEKHLSLLRTRLKANPQIEGLALEKREDIEKAIDVLDAKSEEIIKGTASRVFISTAISQNGNLDALLVLSAQSKMVWQVAHVYYQRPTVREITRLYANVLSTAFVAGELDDIDIGEQVEPIVASTLGSLAGAIPGLQTVTSIVTNSIVSGAANAFLTLRVGMITRKYCNALVAHEKSLIRKSAIAESTGLLGSIVLAGAKRVSVSFLSAAKNKLGGAVTGTGERVRDMGKSLLDKMRATEEGDSADSDSAGLTASDL